jgi:hypothetical protein
MRSFSMMVRRSMSWWQSRANCSLRTNKRGSHLQRLPVSRPLALDERFRFKQFFFELDSLLLKRLQREQLLLVPAVSALRHVLRHRGAGAAAQMYYEEICCCRVAMDSCCS